LDRAGDDDGVDVPDTSSPTIPQPPPTKSTQEPTPSPEEQSTPKPVWQIPKNPRPNSPVGRDTMMKICRDFISFMCVFSLKSGYTSYLLVRLVFFCNDINVYIFADL